MLPFQKTKENIVHFPGSRFVSCDQLDNKFHILLMFFLFFHMYPSVLCFIERLFVLIYTKQPFDARKLGTLYRAQLHFLFIIRAFSTKFVTFGGIVQNSGHFFTCTENHIIQRSVLSALLPIFPCYPWLVNRFR